jgi:hypothetical protein
MKEGKKGGEKEGRKKEVGRTKGKKAYRKKEW